MKEVEAKAIEMEMRLKTEHRELARKIGEQAPVEFIETTRLTNELTKRLHASKLRGLETKDLQREVDDLVKGLDRISNLYTDQIVAGW